MSLSTDLLFLHGHLADPRLATALADRPATVLPPVSRSKTMDLFKSLMYLGGRPMHAGHNYDIEDPFEQSFGNRVAFERTFGKPVAASHAVTTQRADSGLGEGVVRGCG